MNLERYIKPHNNGFVGTRIPGEKIPYLVTSFMVVGEERVYSGVKQ